MTNVRLVYHSTHRWIKNRLLDGTVGSVRFMWSINEKVT